MNVKLVVNQPCPKVPTSYSEFFLLSMFVGLFDDIKAYMSSTDY